MTRCPSTCDGNRCTRPVGYRGHHKALTPSGGWPEPPEFDRAAEVQAVAKRWEQWLATLPWAPRTAAATWQSAQEILHLAADAGLSGERLRELARRIAK